MPSTNNRVASPRSFPNNAALGRNTRVVMIAGYLALATAKQRAIGTLEFNTQTTDAVGSVQLPMDSRTKVCVANGAITQYTRVYAADSGKVSQTGTVCEGVALEAAGADGDFIEVLPILDPHEKLFAAVAASTAVTNTVTETLFDQNYTFDANTLQAGDVIKIRYQGIATATHSTDTLAVKLYFGGLAGTVLISHAATDVANSNVFSGEFTIVVRDIGATGHIVGCGTYKAVPAAAGTATYADAVLASTAIDTTAAQQIGVSATWSVADPGNSCRLDILNIERLAA